MRAPLHAPALKFQRGFTLAELMVAMGVLAVLCSLVLQVMSSANRLTTGSRQSIDCDTEARYALDQISADLSLRIKRPDASAYLDKRNGDDRLYFFANVPGFSSSLPANERSNQSLVGYRIHQVGTSYALQRYARALPWETSGENKAMPLVMFDHTLDSADKSSPVYVLKETTLAGAFPNLKTEESSEDNYYQTIAENVVRFEVSILTKPTTFDEVSGTLLDTPLPSATSPHFPSNQPPEMRIQSELDRHGFTRLSAVVITMAIMDPQNLARTDVSQLQTFVLNASFDTNCSDSSNALPMMAWTNELATQASRLPKPIRSGIRFYQRVIPL